MSGSSHLPPPAKKPRLSSTSSTAANTSVAKSSPVNGRKASFGSMQQLPVLLRNLDAETIKTKTLEGLMMDRILRKSDVIDRIIEDQFLNQAEPQNRNKITVNEAKYYIIRLIRPILGEAISQAIENLESQGAGSGSIYSEHQTSTSPTRNLPNTSSHQPQIIVTDQELAPSSTKEWVQGTPGFRTIDPISAPATYPTAFNQIQPPPPPAAAKPVGGDEIGAPLEQIFSQSPNRQIQRGSIGGDNFPVDLSSPVRERQRERARSIAEHSISHRSERSIRSARSASKAIDKTCTFCTKVLPSPSAKKEHEAIHVDDICQYKQYQCRACSYRSHRPREVFHHMRNKHAGELKPRNEKDFKHADLVDHGPLPEAEMAKHRETYKKSNPTGPNMNLTMASFERPSSLNRDKELEGKLDRDDAVSHSGPMSIDDYALTTPVRAPPSQQPVSSAHNLYGYGSHMSFDGGSFIHADNMGGSQADQSTNQDHYNFPPQQITVNPAAFPNSLQASQHMFGTTGDDFFVSHPPQKLDMGDDDAQGDLNDEYQNFKF